MYLYFYILSLSAFEFNFSSTKLSKILKLFLEKNPKITGNQILPQSAWQWNVFILFCNNIIFHSNWKIRDHCIVQIYWRVGHISKTPTILLVLVATFSKTYFFFFCYFKCNMKYILDLYQTFKNNCLCVN